MILGYQAVISFQSDICFSRYCELTAQIVVKGKERR